MPDWITRTGGFMPRGGGHEWTDDTLLLQFLANLGIALAYFAIPIQIHLFLRHTDLPVWARRITRLFAAFVLACGIGHALKVLMIWWPAYRVEAWWDVITAAISLLTAALLWPVLQRVRCALIDVLTPDHFATLANSFPFGMAIYDIKGGKIEDVEIVHLNRQAVRNIRLVLPKYNENGKQTTMQQLAAAAQTSAASSQELWESLNRARDTQESFFAQVEWAEKYWRSYYVPIRNTTYVALIYVEVTDVVYKARKLEEAKAASDQFTYVVSHDLQSPLRQIEGFVKLLVEECGTQLSDDARQYLDFILKGAQHSREVVNGLLTLSRTGQEMVLTSQDLNAVLSDALTVLSAEIEESGAVIDTGSLPTLRVDRVLILQVFQNLIHNAIKFRDPDKPCRIEVAGVAVSGGYEIVVRDNGKGFPPRYAERIFQIFHRLNKRVVGSGVGLALCRKIIERHRGTITADGAPGEGSTFTIFLPK